MRSTSNLKRIVSCLLVGSLFSSAFAQEGSFADYKQPNPDHILFKTGFDGQGFGITSFAEIGAVSVSYVTGYSGLGYPISPWPADGDANNNGTAGFKIVNPSGMERKPAYYDLSFLYNASAGSPSKYRVDLYYRYGNGANNISLGTTANGGILELAGSGSWRKAYVHRLQDLVDFPGSTNYTAPTEIRVVALQDNTGHYPAFGTYNSSATLVVDNVRLTVPAPLSGMYKLSGGTSNDLGLFTFANSGVSVGTFTNWVQTIGNVDILNVYGRQRVEQTPFSTNVLYTKMDSGIRKFYGSRFTQPLTGLSGTIGLGSGANGNLITDRFYGVCDTFSPAGYPQLPQWPALFRQVTTSVYSHSIKYFGGVEHPEEVPIDLGNEQIVAIADLNCDGSDDYITRSGNNLRFRLFQGNSGSGASFAINLSSPATLTTYGNLSCFTKADVNNDGFDDLILQDTSTGDVFSLICNPSGGTLDWLFTLNSNEKLLAVADMDNDQIPDVYCKRDFSPSVGKLTIRKMAADGLSVTTYDLLCEYANATYQPIAVGDINADGAADVVFGGNDSPNYSVYNALVNPSPNPLARNILLGQYWICSAGTPTLKPIYYMGAN